MNILDGKVVSAAIKEQLAAEVNAGRDAGLRAPKLVAVLVGDDGASETYVASKAKNSASVGIDSEILRFDSSISEDTLLEVIERLNHDNGVDAYIVQTPLPKHISVNKVMEAIHPSKDADGFHPFNVGKMFKGEETFLPATPYGITLMLEHYNLPTTGKHCVIIGRSDIVGKPMAALMWRNAPFANCTVTVCHSKSQNMAEITRQADILIAAVGIPSFVKANMVKSGAVVIDVGITRVPADNSKGFRIAGDVDFEAVAPLSSWITPVPGGVGLMTIVGLLKNTVKAWRKNNPIPAKH